MCNINKLREPEYLILMWRGPSDDGSNLKVAKLEKKGDNFVFSYLTQTEDFENAQKQGFKHFSGFSDVNKIYETNVIDYFVTRMPPRFRRDFPNYLESLGISRNLDLETVSDFALLAYSGAVLATDTFRLINPFNNIQANDNLKLEVVGCRHHPNFDRNNLIERLNNKEHIEVKLIEEPTNKHDKNAVQVFIDNAHVGYINKIQALAIKKSLKEFTIESHLYKANGTEERPRLFICLHVSE